MKKNTRPMYHFLFKVHLCAAFQLKCPEPTQWRLRANSHCADPSKYSCVQNDIINGYSENCTWFDFQQAGKRISHLIIICFHLNAVQHNVQKEYQTSTRIFLNTCIFNFSYL